VPHPSPLVPGSRSGGGAGFGGRAGRALALGIAALGLLSLVALASQGPFLRTQNHRRQGHLPAWITGVFALVEVVAAALFLYGMAVVRRDRRPKRVAGMWSVLIVVVLAAMAGLVMHGHRHRQPAASQKPAAARAAPAPAAPPARPPAGSGTTWVEVVLLATAALVALGAATRPRRQPAGAGLDDPLTALVGDSLDDLRAEPDPRKAVIAAYARMERGLGACGLARSPAETAVEYLSRVLTDRRVSRAAASRLTGLFEQAKFSDHAVGSNAKQDAIAALEAVRDELSAGLAGEALAVAGGDRYATAPAADGSVTR
jgi:MFS family permease